MIKLIWFLVCSQGIFKNLCIYYSYYGIYFAYVFTPYWRTDVFYFQILNYCISSFQHHCFVPCKSGRTKCKMVVRFRSICVLKD